MIDIVKDMSTLTTIPEKTLNKFYRKMIYCICEGVEETILEGNESISIFDIGIGTLYIKHETSSNIKYHFEPNDYLNKAIFFNIANGKKNIEDTLDDALSKYFIEV